MNSSDPLARGTCDYGPDSGHYRVRVRRAVEASVAWELSTAAVASQLMNVADWATVVLSSATFALVLIAELRFRRRYTAVSWWLHYDHAENDPDTDEPRYHHYVLMNLGTESATNVSLSATSGLQTTGSISSVVKSGENYTCRIEAADFDNDWILVSWIDASDRRYILYQWFPMNHHGPLGDEQMRQHRVSTRRKRWHRIRLKTRPVGPGAGVILSRVRTGQKDYAQYMRDHDTAHRLLDVTRENHTGIRLPDRRA